jgi:hypothetical protein
VPALDEGDTNYLFWLVQVINQSLYWRCASGNLDVNKGVSVVAESAARVINAPITEKNVFDNHSDGIPSATRAQRSLCSLFLGNEAVHGFYLIRQIRQLDRRSCNPP